MYIVTIQAMRQFPVLHTHHLHIIINNPCNMILQLQKPFIVINSGLKMPPSLPPKKYTVRTLPDFLP